MESQRRIRPLRLTALSPKLSPDNPETDGIGRFSARSMPIRACIKKSRAPGNLVGFFLAG
jgi:hypothetical protein